MTKSTAPVVLKSARIRRRLALFAALGAFSAHAGTDALVDTASLWGDGRIEVCFATSSTVVNPKADMAADVRKIRRVRDHSPLEDRIRAVLDREYTPERTGMRFTGYGNCDRVPRDERDAPAFIFADTDSKTFGLTSIGDESKELEPADRRGLISGSIFGLAAVRANKDYSVARAAKALLKVVEPGSPTANTIVNLAADLDEELKDQLVDVTILHEMGHLAGLLHEERRKDAKANQPEWCRSADDGRDQDPKSEKTVGTEFDPFSVMNYCTDDIAKGFAFYHLFCEVPGVSAELARHDANFDWALMEPFCGFMQSRNYAARLSIRDRAALRRVYLGVPVPPGSRSYRSNPEEVRALRALGALYEALPDSMEVDETAPRRPLRPRR